MILNMMGGGEKVAIVSKQVTVNGADRSISFTGLSGTPKKWVMTVVPTSSSSVNLNNSRTSIGASSETSRVYSVGIYSTQLESTTYTATTDSNSITLRLPTNYCWAPGMYYLCYSYD